MLFNIVLLFAFFIDRRVDADSIDLTCWTVTEQMHYTDQGLEQAPFNDLGSCIKHCLSLPQCSIFDIDTATTPQCWVPKKIFEPTRTALKPIKTVTNYMLDRKCAGLLPAIDMKCWSVSPKMHYLGLNQVKIDNLFDCLNFCIGLPQCGTIDFDESTSPRCWVQLKSFEVKTSAIESEDKVTNYILKRSCLNSENSFGVNKYVQQCWKETPKHHYSGLEKTDLNDLASCTSLCSSLPQCGTVDIDDSTKGKCWVQKKSFTVNSNEVKPRLTTTNYILDRNCYDGLVEEDLKCWIVTPEHHYQRLEMTSFNDMGSCLGYCKSLPQCNTFDIDNETNGKCWVQTKTFEATLNALKPKPSVTNYFFDKKCLKTISAIDLSCWEVNNKQNYKGLTSAPFNNLQECLSHCRNQPSCHVVDFDSATTPKCWIQTNEFDINRNILKPRDTNINFLLKPHCYIQVDPVKPTESSVRPAISSEHERY